MKNRILEFKYYSFEENKLFIRLNSLKDLMYISELKGEPIIKHYGKTKESVAVEFGVEKDKKKVERGIGYYVFTDLIIYYCILKEEFRLNKDKKGVIYYG